MSEDGAVIDRWAKDLEATKQPAQAQRAAWLTSTLFHAALWQGYLELTTCGPGTEPRIDLEFKMEGSRRGNSATTFQVRLQGEHEEHLFLAETPDGENFCLTWQRSGKQARWNGYIAEVTKTSFRAALV